MSMSPLGRRRIEAEVTRDPGCHVGGRDAVEAAVGVDTPEAEHGLRVLVAGHRRFPGHVERPGGIGGGQAQHGLGEGLDPDGVADHVGEQPWTIPGGEHVGETLRPAIHLVGGVHERGAHGEGVGMGSQRFGFALGFRPAVVVDRCRRRDVVVRGCGPVEEHIRGDDDEASPMPVGGIGHGV